MVPVSQRPSRTRSLIIFGRTRIKCRRLVRCARRESVCGNSVFECVDVGRSGMGAKQE